MALSKRQLASEEVYGEKWNRCLSDTLVKTASGLALGIVLSTVLFKRRPWAVFLGTGIGLGMGYSNCQNDFRSPYVPSPSVPLTRADRHVPLAASQTD